MHCRSHDHKMAESGRDLWRSSCPTTLLKQGHLEPLAQDPVYMAFEDLQGQRLHISSGQPVPVLGHLYNKKKKVFPDVQTISCVPVYAHWFLFCHWAPLKMACLSSLQPPFRYLNTLIRSPWSPLFSWLDSPNSFSLSSFVGCSTPLIILVAFC